MGNTIGINMTGTAPTATIGYSYGYVRGTARLYKAYGAGDLRRDWSLSPFTYNNTTGAEVRNNNTSGWNRDCGKYRRRYEVSQTKDKNYTAINFPMLRYADVLLMLAEAENQVNGPTTIAYDAINQVRRRGYGVNINSVSSTADLPSSLSKIAFQQAVEDEPYRELCFEGTRHSDLIRWDKYASTMNAIGNEIATAPTGFSGTN